MHGTRLDGNMSTSVIFETMSTCMKLKVATMELVERVEACKDVGIASAFQIDMLGALVTAPQGDIRANSNCCL